MSMFLTVAGIGAAYFTIGFLVASAFYYLIFSKKNNHDSVDLFMATLIVWPVMLPVFVILSTITFLAEDYLEYLDEFKRHRREKKAIKKQNNSDIQAY